MNLLTLYVIITFVIILTIYGSARIYFVAKNSSIMMLLGFISIEISVFIIISIKNFEKTNFPIFSGLKVAGYIINISLAALGANIIAGAISRRAEYTVLKHKKHDIKLLEEYKKI